MHFKLEFAPADSYLNFHEKLANQPPADKINRMELIFLFAKILEYLFIAPLGWAAIRLAGIFYPLEGDPRQDFLGMIFSFLIVMAIGFSAYYWFASPNRKAPEALQQTPVDAPALQDLNAALKTLSPGESHP